jgi:excisionase family DNA binding protein
MRTAETAWHEDVYVTTTRKRLVTAQEVADRLGLAVSTVRWAAWAGKLPAIRMSPRCIRFDPDEIERYIDTHRTTTEAAA